MDSLGSQDQSGLRERVRAERSESHDECFRWCGSLVGCASVHASRFQALKPEAGNRRVVARFIFLGTQEADQVCSSDQGKREAWTVHGSSFRRETRAATLAKAEDENNRRGLPANHTKSLGGSETSKREQDARRTVESRTQGMGNAAGELVQVGN